VCDVRGGRSPRGWKTHPGESAGRQGVNRLSEQPIIGQQGVHVPSARLLSVGLSFQPTGALDPGSDGFLELRDRFTGEVRAQWISRNCTHEKRSFSKKTDESFSFICERKDLDYWLGSNVPVILFIAMLSEN
jgi:hypothetical protein